MKTNIDDAKIRVATTRSFPPLKVDKMACLFFILGMFLAAFICQFIP